MGKINKIFKRSLVLLLSAALTLNSTGISAIAAEDQGVKITSEIVDLGEFSLENSGGISLFNAQNAKVDLKALARQLGTSSLSFASEERLEKYLKLKQGSVTPFGLINDTDHAVEFFIDRSLSKCKSLGIHPCDNTATVFLSYKDLDKFLWNLDIDVIQIRF